MNTWKYGSVIRINCTVYLDVLDIEGTEGRMAGRVEVDEQGGMVRRCQATDRTFISTKKVMQCKIPKIF